MPLPARSGSPGGQQGGEAWRAGHTRATEGSQVSPGRTDRPTPPGEGKTPPGQGCGRPFNPKPMQQLRRPGLRRRPAGLPAAAPGRMGKDQAQGGQCRASRVRGKSRRAAERNGAGQRDGRPGQPSSRPPGRPPPPPPPGPGRHHPARSSPHLQADPRCRPRDKSVELTRRGEGRRSRNPAHHPRPPASP